MQLRRSYVMENLNLLFRQDRSNCYAKEEKLSQWRIIGTFPDCLEKEIRERDKACVYCGVEFTPARVSKRTAASWEHIINDAKIITRENIALCCCGCNSSKGKKQLSVWLQSKYCKDHDITPEAAAPLIKHAIANGQ